jgi:GH25 family lysozyme M1 (1,4-beta-N-acetylmuramidase)
MTTPIFGIDAASMQHRVDWAAVDNSTAFGSEKVTQGTGYTNPYWADAKTQLTTRAKATGFVPGAYMFLEQGNATAQANHFAAVAGNLNGFLIFADIEPTGASNPTLADAKECVQRLRELYPHHPIGGYIPHWYWGARDTTFVDWLFQSHYVNGSGTPASLYAQVTPDFWDSYGGKTPAVLQFTSSATVPGVAGRCDCSAFRGTPDAFRKLVLPAVAPAGPVTPGHVAYKAYGNELNWHDKGKPLPWWGMLSDRERAGWEAAAKEAAAKARKP